MKLSNWRLVGITKLWQNLQVSSWQSTRNCLFCIQEDQVKAEAERNKFEQTLKILEEKLKTHQANIKTMQENLTCREKEKQVSTSNNM